MAIGIEQIATNRYAPSGCDAINLYSTGVEGGSGLTLGQLSIAVCLTAAAAYEGQSVVKMNTMTSGSVKLDAAASWLTKVADGTADWSQAKAFATGELGIEESELPDGIDTYAKRMAAATAFKKKMDVLVQQQQRDVVDLQTMVNRRDVAYSTSSNIVNALGNSQEGNAANF
ncbi:MAG: hypothetical protein IJS36_04320 [Kiritimatiellae bacterium]|nr:hypothetical protein [Kiritimatiellia bacterium]